MKRRAAPEFRLRVRSGYAHGRYECSCVFEFEYDHRDHGDALERMSGAVQVGLSCGFDLIVQVYEARAVQAAVSHLQERFPGMPVLVEDLRGGGCPAILDDDDGTMMSESDEEQEPAAKSRRVDCV